MFTVIINNQTIKFCFQHEVPFKLIDNSIDKKKWVYNRQEGTFYGTKCFCYINNYIISELSLGSKEKLFGLAFLHKSDDFNFNKEVGRRIALKNLLIRLNGFKILELSKEDKKIIWLAYFKSINKNYITKSKI